LTHFELNLTSQRAPIYPPRGWDGGKLTHKR